MAGGSGSEFRILELRVEGLGEIRFRALGFWVQALGGTTTETIFTKP